VAEPPVISGREAVRAFGKAGYEMDRQRGSHMVLRQAQSPYRRLTIPDHKELKKGNAAGTHPAGWIVRRRVCRIALMELQPR
jgi:predicted RNA binding protein YcfA (HicA-like mRNA interferase family)